MAANPSTEDKIIRLRVDKRFGYNRLCLQGLPDLPAESSKYPLFYLTFKP
jgi:hypothetical protein